MPRRGVATSVQYLTNCWDSTPPFESSIVFHTATKLWKSWQYVESISTAWQDLRRFHVWHSNKVFYTHFLFVPVSKMIRSAGASDLTEAIRRDFLQVINFLTIKSLKAKPLFVPLMNLEMFPFSKFGIRTTWRQENRHGFQKCSVSTPSLPQWGK